MAMLRTLMQTKHVQRDALVLQSVQSGRAEERIWNARVNGLRAMAAATSCI
jgi:hypothetical protein